MVPKAITSAVWIRIISGGVVFRLLSLRFFPEFSTMCSACFIQYVVFPVFASKDIALNIPQRSIHLLVYDDPMQDGRRMDRS